MSPSALAASTSHPCWHTSPTAGCCAQQANGLRPRLPAGAPDTPFTSAHRQSGFAAPVLAESHHTTTRPHDHSAHHWQALGVQDDDEPSWKSSWRLPPWEWQLTETDLRWTPCSVSRPIRPSTPDQAVFRKPATVGQHIPLPTGYRIAASQWSSPVGGADDTRQ